EERGPGAVGCPELLSLPPGAPRVEQQPSPGGQGAQAGEAAADLPGPEPGRAPVCLGGVTGGRRRIRPDPGSGYSGTLLLDRSPPLRAVRRQPGRSRSPVRPGQGTGEGTEGTDRAGGLARGAGAA